jgi:hypothetical protein
MGRSPLGGHRSSRAQRSACQRYGASGQDMLQGPLFFSSLERDLDRSAPGYGPIQDACMASDGLNLPYIAR